jgi:hypothetical protein
VGALPPPQPRETKRFSFVLHEAIYATTRADAAGIRFSSDGALAELAPFALGEPAPDAEAFVVGECVLQALHSNLA